MINTMINDVSSKSITKNSMGKILSLMSDHIFQTFDISLIGVGEKSE